MAILYFRFARRTRFPRDGNNARHLSRFYPYIRNVIPFFLFCIRVLLRKFVDSIWYLEHC